MELELYYAINEIIYHITKGIKLHKSYYSKISMDQYS